MNIHLLNVVRRKFEIDPFVSEVARWIDNEVTSTTKQFEGNDLAERIDVICAELHYHGVTRMDNGRLLWTAVPEIQERIGGSDIACNFQFEPLGQCQSSILDGFQSAVEVHAESRLGTILKYVEACFRLCNDGRIKVGAIESRGRFVWKLNSFAN